MLKTILSVIALCGAGAIFFGYTQPTYDDVKTVNAQVAQYDEALTKAADLKKLRDGLLTKLQTFDPADLDRLEKLLPDHVDNVRLILDIDSLAGRHGMAIQNVAVSSSQAGQATKTAIGAVSASKQKYDSLTLKFTTQGTYENFRAFLDDTQKSLRIVDLVSLGITRAAEDKATPVGSPLLYNFEVSLKTYWLK